MGLRRHVFRGIAWALSMGLCTLSWEPSSSAPFELDEGFQGVKGSTPVATPVGVDILIRSGGSPFSRRALSGEPRSWTSGVTRMALVALRTVEAPAKSVAGRSMYRYM